MTTCNRLQQQFPNGRRRVAIPAFIFVWATGYVVAKLAAKDAEALSFLIVRYLGDDHDGTCWRCLAGQVAQQARCAAMSRWRA